MTLLYRVSAKLIKRGVLSNIKQPSVDSEK